MIFGDGSLCTFSSATEALRCAIEMQQQFQMEPKVPLRIGLHVGEIFFEDGKVFGDGVNIVSRVQSLGIANSILFSSEINSKIKNQQEFKCVSLGKFHFKNIDEPMEVFALTNEGLVVPRKEELTGKLKEIEKKSVRRKLMIIAATVIVLIAAFFIYQSLFRTTYPPESEKSIAVLPFENIAVNDSEEYISDGITQGIINNLSKISSLQKVIGWFSVKSFKKTNKSVKQIAQELGVAVILTGTIQRNADKIRIIAELIEVNTNKRLWGNDYNYDWGDILSIQSEVAQEIVTALRANLSSEEKKGLSKHYTENIKAYKFYRKGRWFWDKRTTASYDCAAANYKRAIVLDPDYALAYSGLADVYILPQNGMTLLEAMPIARDYALKALSLDSCLSEALTTLGFIQSIFDYDWQKSEITLKKAIGLNPNYPIAYIYYGNLLQYTGKSAERGIAEIKKALELDPLSSSINWVLGRNYYLAGKIDSAYVQLKKAIAMDPTYPHNKGTLALVLLAKKNIRKHLTSSGRYPEPELQN
jgi:adenylate cyclase